MEWHPYAKLFPMISDAELHALAEDIGKNGLRHAIIVDPKNRIIDGRNRAAACEIAQVKPTTRVFDGSDREILDIVISENIHRRHLTDRQRAMIAAEIANLPNGGDRKSENQKANGPTDRGLVSQSQAAELMNVSDRSLRRARTVKEHAIPEVAAAVVQDDLALRKAEDISRLPKGEQATALKAATEAAPRTAEPSMHGRTPIGVMKANDAVNCLKAIPKNDALRKRGFQIVTDWIKHNSKEK